MVNRLGASESGCQVCILRVNELAMRKKELWALWVDLGLTTLRS